MQIISGTSNRPLAQAVATQFGVPLSDVEISRFANGEKRVWVKDDVRGQNVVILQSLSQPTDEHIIELLLLVDAVERQGARHVNVVVPWMGYSLQDKVFREGEPIAAKVVANLISNAYVKRVFVLDLHNSSTPGFFSIPTQHISAMELFVNHVQQHWGNQPLVVASPDFGGLKRARVFAEKLGVELVNVDKQRDLHTGQTKAVDVSGDVQGKVVIVFDDVINAGGTVVNTAQLLKDRGAQAVHFLATHGLFADQGRTKIEASVVDSVVVTNSVPAPSPEDSTAAATPPAGSPPDRSTKIQYLDASPLFVTALRPWLESSPRRE